MWLLLELAPRPQQRTVALYQPTCHSPRPHLPTSPTSPAHLLTCRVQGSRSFLGLMRMAVCLAGEQRAMTCRPHGSAKLGHLSPYESLVQNVVAVLREGGSNVDVFLVLDGIPPPKVLAALQPMALKLLNSSDAEAQYARLASSPDEYGCSVRMHAHAHAHAHVASTCRVSTHAHAHAYVTSTCRVSTHAHAHAHVTSTCRVSLASPESSPSTTRTPSSRA
jgi:hypothetical protein